MVVRVVFVWVSLRGTDMGLLYVPVCSYSCVSSWECMQVQGMLPSPPHPPTHPNPKVCVCVCTIGNVCKSKVCYHPHPTHPPTPTQRYVCVCAVGNVCKSKVCYHPHPTHPPTPKVCVCVHVCTDESPKTRCVYRWVRSVCCCCRVFGSVLGSLLI